MLYIGIDLGTSAVKLLLMDGEGTIQNVVSREYPLEFPRPGWSQQDPEDWKMAVLEGIPQLLRGFDAGQVAGIGAGGQMHGLVVLDGDGQVIRPAILWNDGRTAKGVEYLNGAVGQERLGRLTANIAFAGFTAPKLLWMRENEPERFARIRKIMLPKDYINYVLTGVHCTDYSDASGTLLLDVARRCWSGEMLDLCGVTEEQMPRLFENYETVGTLRSEIAGRLGVTQDQYQEDLANSSLCNILSLDSIFDDPEQGGMDVPDSGSVGRPEDSLLRRELLDTLTEGITSLRENEQLVISLYYRKNLSMKEIAQVMEVSEPRISQIHSRAIQKLKLYMNRYINGEA